MLNSIIHRYHEWQKLQPLFSFERQMYEKSGSRAETWLGRHLKQLINHPETYIFSEKRVMAPGFSGRSEIDHIVLTPKTLHIFEVKNWAGKLRLGENGCWLQVHKRRRKRLQFRNPVMQNFEKLERLLAYLANEGCPLPLEWVSHKLIITNRKLKIARPIRKNPAVLTIPKLERYLGRPLWQAEPHERVICDFLEHHFPGGLAEHLVGRLYGRLTQARLQPIIEALDKLPTWDCLVSKHNEKYKGDVLELKVGERSYRRRQIRSASPLRFEWARSRWAGWPKVLFGWPLGQMAWQRRRPVPLTGNDYVIFQPAGQKRPRTVYLRDLSEIRIG